MTTADTSRGSIADPSHTLFALLDDGPAVVEEMTGRRPHRSALWRWASRGMRGETLRAVSVGRCRMTTRAWLLDFWSRLEAANKPTGRRRRNRR